jgi:hypothetical protein
MYFCHTLVEQYFREGPIVEYDQAEGVVSLSAHSIRILERIPCENYPTWLGDDGVVAIE